MKEEWEIVLVMRQSFLLYYKILPRRQPAVGVWLVPIFPFVIGSSSIILFIYMANRNINRQIVVAVFAGGTT